MNKKIILLIILCFTMVCSLFGCGLTSRLSRLDNEMIKMEKENRETSDKLLECLGKNDTEGLKRLLCEKTKDLTDIDKQLQEANRFFEGNVISFNEDVSGYEGEAIADGRRTEHERSWNINDIKTDDGNTYKIHIHTYLIYERDTEREGITDITIENEDEQKVEIGYHWPDYDRKGIDLSYKIILALSVDDFDGLKATLCQKTLEIPDIEKQIQDGLNFFDGIITLGYVDESEKQYDGKHDYKTTIVDEEIVENHEPVSTYISVTNKNIETKEGITYEVEFSSYLLNEDKSLEGVSKIKIKSDDGKEYIIGK